MTTQSIKQLEWEYSPDQSRRDLVDIYAAVMGGSVDDLNLWHRRAVSGNRQYLLAEYSKRGNPLFGEPDSTGWYLVVAVDGRYTDLHAYSSTNVNLEDEAVAWDTLTEQHVRDLVQINQIRNGSLDWKYAGKGRKASESRPRSMTGLSPSSTA